MSASSELIGCKSSATKAELLLFLVFRDHFFAAVLLCGHFVVIVLNKTANYTPIFVTPTENLNSSLLLSNTDLQPKALISPSTYKKSTTHPYLRLFAAADFKNTFMT